MFVWFFQVKDRSLIQTTDAERRMTSPEGLQAKIDSIVAKFSQARSFVRLVDKLSVWLTCLYLSYSLFKKLICVISSLISLVRIQTHLLIDF